MVKYQHNLYYFLLVIVYVCHHCKYWFQINLEYVLLTVDHIVRLLDFNLEYVLLTMDHNVRLLDFDNF